MTTIDHSLSVPSPKSITGPALAGKTETMVLNMGPHHPSTHGVLRLVVELDGETVVNVAPDLGFLHTGIEKNMEFKTYQQAVVMTDRTDYLAPLSNNLSYVLAVEKLLGCEIPERATTARVLLVELQRISSHLVWLGTHALDLAAMSVFLYGFREREQILDPIQVDGHEGHGVEGVRSGHSTNIQVRPSIDPCEPADRRRCSGRPCCQRAFALPRRRADHSASRLLRAAAICSFFAASTAGHSRPSPRIVPARTAATAARLTHFLSAGITYQGACSVLVSRIASS